MVVSVLSILAAIGIPSFNCFQRKSKATAVLTTMKQIQNDCLYKKETKSSEKEFIKHWQNKWLFISGF